MSAEYVEVVRSCFESWNRGDLEAILAVAHPEIEWSSDVVRRLEGAGAVYHGPEGMRRYWDDFHAVWDVTIEITEVRDLGETVLALGCIRSRAGSSGVGLDRPAGWVFEFKDGLLWKGRAFLDPREALAAARQP